MKRMRALGKKEVGRRRADEGSRGQGMGRPERGISGAADWEGRARAAVGWKKH